MGDKVANTSRKETSHPEREMDLKFVKALHLKVSIVEVAILCLASHL